MNKGNKSSFLYQVLFLKCYIMLNLVTPNPDSLFDRSTDFNSHKQILLFCTN